jgi:endoglycosylceramidase
MATLVVSLLIPLVVACLSSASRSTSHRAAPPVDRFHIYVRDRWLVDDAGRVRLFHGFNSVMKGVPWYDLQMLNVTRLDWYRRWGLNVVRLGVMWTGAQPVGQHAFNETYLQVIEQIVELLRVRNISVVFDMHQDVLSTAFDAYDGVPRWLVDRLLPSPHKYPWPFQGSIPSGYWALGYLTQAVGLAFQQLYDNVAGARDAMGAFWKKIASVFANRSNVIGYELINEPWAGDVIGQPSLLAPVNAGRLNLGPFYDVLNAAIRSVDNRTLIFYEPVTWSVFLSGNYSGTGFSTVPGGDEYRDRSVLSYHYYCWFLPVNETERHKKYIRWQRTICDDIIGSQVMPNVQREIMRLGGSSFLTEFGLCSPDGNAESLDTVECNFILDQADAHLQSWTYWDSTFFDDSESGKGNINWDVVRSFSRVYAQAVSGIPVNMNFNLTSRLFNLSWIIDPSISQPTEIFLPLLHYPRGFVVNVSLGLDWIFDVNESTLYVTNIAYRNSTTVSVDIMPAGPLEAQFEAMYSDV